MTPKHPMDKDRLKSLLIGMGLSEWESEAYFILIKNGPQTAVELSRLSKIARSKTYEVVTRLRRKGLVMKIPPMPTKGVTQKFVAIDPEKVFQLKISEMKEISEYLAPLYKNPSQGRFPNINFYTSKEGIKELFIDITKKSQFAYFYIMNLDLKSSLGYAFEHHMEDFKKKKNHFILGNSPEIKEFSKTIKNKTFIDQKEGINYIITSESVILDLWKSQHIIIEIISKEAVKTFLEMYWKLKVR
jgi:sugar-specific transcriptional regulator TrmB